MTTIELARIFAIYRAQRRQKPILIENRAPQRKFNITQHQAPLRDIIGVTLSQGSVYPHDVTSEKVG
jgi:hypothetical protein